MASSRLPDAADEVLWSGEPFDASAAFGRAAPLEVELGTGKGRFLIEAARAAPEHDFLGLEMSLAYYRLSRDRIARSGLANARALRAEARRFVEFSLSEGSVRAFHVYFPDPWPKKRQRKRRLLDAVALDVFASRLEPGGFLRVATDHSGYASEIDPLFETVSSLERLPWEDFPAPPPSHYELKYRAEGRKVWRFLLRRRG